MKVITRQILANEAPEAFRKLYGHKTGTNYLGIKWTSISLDLCALPKPVDPDAVDNIMSNASWTRVPSCDECGADKLYAVIEIGEEPDDESSTAHICHACLTSAAIRLAAVEVAP